MSKKNSMIPMPTSSGGTLRKLIGAAILLALLVIVIRHPGDAAGWAKQLFAMVGAIVDGIATFLRQAF